MMVRTTRHGMFNTPKTIAAAPPSGIDSRLVTKMSRFWHVTKNNPDSFVTSDCSRDIFVTFVLDCPENVPNLVNSVSVQLDATDSYSSGPNTAKFSESEHSRALDPNNETFKQRTGWSQD